MGEGEGKGGTCGHEEAMSIFTLVFSFLRLGDFFLIKIHENKKRHFIPIYVYYFTCLFTTR